MTKISFYVHAPNRDRLLYGLLSRKVLPQNMRVYIAASDAAEAEYLDKYLWTAEQGGFLPHAMAGDKNADDSPVLVGAEEPPADMQADMLVWWRIDSPTGFARFQHMIDISGRDGPSVKAARARYKIYSEQGYDIVVHNMGKGGKER